MPIRKNEFEELINNYLDGIADAVFSRSQENLIKNGSVDSGQLLTTGNVNRKFLEKEVVYPAPHAVFVEFGTQPHFVGRKGIAALTRWASRKLGLGEKEARSAAFAIAHKISREGMSPKPFLRPAISEVIELGAV